MRHIDLTTLLPLVFANADGQKAKKSLERAHKKVAKKRTPKTRKKYVDDNGSGKWKPIKDRLTAQLGKKCWYTEVELIGAPLAIDHYRPVCDYWWLSFDAVNYRIACPWANSPEHNAQHGCAGGKGDNFPLLPPSIRATAIAEIPNELPVILDPCNLADCKLLAFQADGRPVINPAFENDPIAVHRVEQSMILLNLDHPEFNSKREQLRLEIKDAVRIYEGLPPESVMREVTRNRLSAKIAPRAPFCTAVRFYLQLHREHDWVQAILDAHP